MKTLKRKLINWVLNSVIKGFDFEEVLQNLDPAQKDKLALKAKEYVADDFWKDFDQMINNLALNKMGRESVNADDMMFSKMILWYHEMRRTKLKEIANWGSKATATTNQKW